MKKEAYVCDACGVERKAVNHWFIVSKKPDGYIDGVDVGESLVVAHFAPTTCEIPDVKHFCGQACVHKFIDEFLSK